MNLRKLDREDLGLLRSLKDESWRDTHRSSFLNMADQDRWFDSLQDSPHTPQNLILVATDPKILRPWTAYGINRVGVFKLLNIDWQNRRAEAGWDVFDLFRRKGYGKQLVIAGVEFARNRLNLHRLRAEILDFNVASIKIAENAGFVREGTERLAVMKAGRYYDSHLYGIILD